MKIQPINNYLLHKGGYLIEKTKGPWYIKALIALCICVYLFVPKNMGFAYKEYTPVVMEEAKPTKIALYVKQVNEDVSDKDAERIGEAVDKYANRFGIDPALLLAVAKVESTFDKYAISNMGATGLLQVLPRWHVDKIKAVRKELGKVELFDIETNVYLGAWILKECQQKHSSTAGALGCYNGNPNGEYASKVLKEKKNVLQYI